MTATPPASVPRNPAAPLLILLSAPSGGGKTTLSQHLLAGHPEITRAITCTTRPPRPGERDGADYYFLDTAAFDRRVAEGGFLEHAGVYGHAYGTPKCEVLERLRQGRDVLLNVDVQGAATICSAADRDPALRGALVTVFLTPASLAELEGRLRKRATDTAAALRKRLSVARSEIAQWRRFQYLIVSTTTAEDLRRMECILEAERMRPSRALPPG
jgi:guanylate kinase